ncbi:hypothetical protein [Lacinutrix chionoecetis]
MSKWLRISLVSLFSITLVIIGVVLVSNHFIKKKVEHFLEYRLPSYISQNYSSIDLNSFEGTVTINEPVINISNTDNQTVHTKISLDKIIVEDVSYWDYLFNDKIHIEDIKLKQPKILYFKDNFLQNKTRDTTTGLVKIFKPFIIDELSIDNATLHIYDKSKDSLMLYVENATIEIDDIDINNNTITKKIPAQFKDYEFEADSIFLKANTFENLMTSSIKLKHNKAKIRDLEFKTKYSRQTMSKIINKERDHFDLKIDSLQLEGIDFGFKNRKLFIKTNAIEINTPNLEIFRDKLVADDLEIKKFYSQSLREIPFNLTVDAVKLKDAQIIYTEKVKAENSGGTITFTNFYATINNVGNTYSSPNKTTLDIAGDFMETTPFKAFWSFDVNNNADDFIFKMNMNSLEFSRVNMFTEPNLKVRLNGELKKMLFTIDGNNTNSTVDMKVDYEDLKISVLNKEGNKKNWLLSTVANLFVSKDSKDVDGNYREAKTEVERDKTKSVFNFIWLNTKQGLLKSMAGDGEKDN